MSSPDGPPPDALPGRLTTERLALRPFAPGDAGAVHALHNDPEVMRYLTGGAPVSRAAIEREFRDRFSEPGHWVAEERATGAFVGWFALRPAGGRPPGELELGYRLRRETWGRGYATEGARALLVHGFAAPGTRRVIAKTMAVNLGSRRVMEKAGLSLARVFHLEWDDPLPGTEHGEVEYAIDRAEWDAAIGH